MLEVSVDLIPRPFVDNSCDEIAKVFRRPHLQLANLGDQFFFDDWPQALGQIGAGCCAALLPLILESTSYKSGDDFIHTSRWVSQNEILTARFPNNARVAFVLRDVLTNGCPQMTENTCRTREVQSGKIWVVEHDVTRDRTIARHHVDDTIRKTRCFEHLHDDLCAIDLGVSRLPHHHIAHERRCRTQIRCNGREIKRSDREDEPFQSAVFHAVPNAVLTVRLNILNFLKEIRVKAQEINQLTGRVNFSLENVLGLCQHGGHIDFGAVGSGNQIRSF